VPEPPSLMKLINMCIYTPRKVKSCLIPCFTNTVSETCKLAGRSDINGFYLENFVFQVIVSRKSRLALESLSNFWKEKTACSK